MLRLTRDGLSYKGTKEGEEFEFFLPSSEVPTFGMCNDVSRFYTFVNGEFLEFYPERESTELWDQAAEEYII